MNWNLQFCCPAALHMYKSLQGTVGPWLTKQLGCIWPGTSWLRPVQCTNAPNPTYRSTVKYVTGFDCLPVIQLNIFPVPGVVHDKLCTVRPWFLKYVDKNGGQSASSFEWTCTFLTRELLSWISSLQWIIWRYTWTVHWSRCCFNVIHVWTDPILISNPQHGLRKIIC